MKPPLPSPRPPLFVLLFFSLFGFIGIAVLIFLWSAQGFGAPPLIFKVVGSLIAMGFIIMGFGVPLSAIKEGASPDGLRDRPDRRAKRLPGGPYKCPNCGGGLDDQEVSPSGDVKCAYCAQWYNIHAQS